MFIRVITIVSNDAAGVPQPLLRTLVNGNISVATGSNGSAALPNSTLSLVPLATGAGTGIQIGDTFDCYCDGKLWYIYASVLLVGALTVTTP